MKSLRHSALTLSILATTFAATYSSAPALAEETPAASPAADPGPLTANITLVNDYRYRGISQSNFQPAIQLAPRV